ncbi:hypothetical protein [Bordetella petrii]|uniref:hypothetical protein n=1 Tax=Bordetella petrii TaxID=94624 RepID=UPI001A959579|nr:hypothetical protein [Bordetella petrii]MBO1110348.1 hypothetical protein [Bordetella petrii]
MTGRGDDRGAGEKRWRRRSMVLLVILLPLVMAFSTHENIERWWKSRDLLAREVAAGEQADFGGARWQLHALRMAPLPAGGNIPGHAMGVVADFRVQIQDADLPGNWRGCTIALQDGQGRRWLPTHVLRLPRSDAQECVSAIFSGAKAGATLRIRQAFLVPREAAGVLRVTVSLLQQKPHYLRFAQHPRLVQ